MQEEGKIIASCGHEISSEWFATEDSTGILIDYDDEGNKGVKIGVYCQACKEEGRVAFNRGRKYAIRHKLLEGADCEYDNCDYCK